MNPRIPFTVLALLTLSANAVEAQKPGTFGVGIAIGQNLMSVDEEDAAPPSLTLTFPMNLGAFRLEPELGYVGYNFKDSDPFIGEFEATGSGLIAAAGMYVMRTDDAFVMYFGPRFGIQRTSGTSKFPSNPETSFSRTDTFFGVALGGEHFFSSHFSLGAEARFTRFSTGTYKREPEPEEPDRAKQTLSWTSGIGMFRFYF